MIERLLENGVPQTAFYSDAAFWLYFVAIVMLMRLSPFYGHTRATLFVVVNIVMLFALPQFNAVSLLIYGAMAIATYAVGRLLNSDSQVKNTRNRKAIGAAGILGVVSLLATFKYGQVQNLVIKDTFLLGGGAADFVFLIGISYASFRAMHFIIESYKRQIKRVSFLSFVNYLIFFPSFVSGPIARYNEFASGDTPARVSPWRADFARGLERIVHGLFKKFVLTTILAPYVIGSGTPLETVGVWHILTGLYAYALYYYFDFAAYTDLAIGSARMLGYSLPENFNNPFMKRNIQQLWASTHMSLTGWLTDYVYWPLVRKLRTFEAMRTRPLLTSNSAIVLTFLLCGAWHGETLNFLLWGLYHGLGIACVNIYQHRKRKMRSPGAVRYFASPLSHSLGIVVTFNFFAVGLILWLSPAQLATVFQRLL